MLIPLMRKTAKEPGSDVRIVQVSYCLMPYAFDFRLLLTIFVVCDEIARSRLKGICLSRKAFDSRL